VGYYNLAVFYLGCSFDCLFCQNAQHRIRSRPKSWVSSEELAREAHTRVTCICFFGGDPSPQADHALRTARLAREMAGDRPMRICWETNGSESPDVLRAMARQSMDSGGIVKVDFKAWNETVHLALCGVEPYRTRENIEQLAREAERRPDPPLLAVSTLLVPGYVDEEEVRPMARFLASLDRDIPYTLLAFHPQFHMDDLPLTPRSQAEACLRAARQEGLRRVRIGNVHLLM
jgi:pyruvate formate lyase activating enzyme